MFIPSSAALLTPFTGSLCLLHLALNGVMLFTPERSSSKPC